MSFNYELFKAAFRKRAVELGIDPATGLTDAQHAMSQPTSFAVALENARLRKQYHEATQTRDFDQHMRRHPFQFVTDEQKALMRAANWWSQDADMWRCGGAEGRYYVENEACARVYHEAKRLENARKPETQASDEPAWKTVWKEEAQAMKVEHALPA